MSRTVSNKMSHTALILFALLAGLFLSPGIPAQESSFVDSRFLFIFSTSAEMKNRLKLTQSELDQLLAFGIKGEMHPNDTLGVWTFDQELRTGKFPMMAWSPENAATIADEITKFVREQRFSKTNNFGRLMPVLDQVIETSPRLTVLIFCDGENDIVGTPYDDGINRIFRERRPIMKKSRQPFVIVMRTQLGKYVGCTINFPPGMVNVPPFPPFPQPQPPAITNTPTTEAATNNASAPSKPLPLVIIGKRVETNWQAYQFALTNPPVAPANPAATETNSVPATNPPAPKVERTETNPPANTPVSANTAAVSASTNAPAATNVATVSKKSNGSRDGTLALAAGFLIGAIALAAIFFFRSRRDHGSLISRSMKK